MEYFLTSLDVHVPEWFGVSNLGVRHAVNIRQWNFDYSEAHVINASGERLKVGPEIRQEWKDVGGVSLATQGSNLKYLEAWCSSDNSRRNTIANNDTSGTESILYSVSVFFFSRKKKSLQQNKRTHLPVYN